MRIDTQTIHSLPVQSSANQTNAPRAARWVPIVATVFVTTAAVLLASGLAVVMSLT